MLGQAVSVLFGSSIELHQAMVLQPGKERMVQRNGSGTDQNHAPVTIENQGREHDEDAEVGFDPATALLDQQGGEHHVKHRFGVGVDLAPRPAPLQEQSGKQRQGAHDQGQNECASESANNQAEQIVGGGREPHDAVNGAAVIFQYVG